MKYCAQYSNKINMTDFDEISIIYNNEDEQLIDFLQKHYNQSIILIVKDIEKFAQIHGYKMLNAIKEKYPNLGFSVCFKAIGKFEEAPDTMVQVINKLQIPFFTGDVVTNFDQLHYLLELGVSEIYLAEDICFDLRRVKQVCDHYNVKLRAFPNVAQSSVKATPPLKKFFIRPEDVKEYSDIIDTLEFWGPADRQEILLKIYKKEYWYGDLNPLILDLNLSLDSRRILPGFAKARKTCERKCMKGRHCTVCDNIYNISKQLEDQQLIIQKKKEY